MKYPGHIMFLSKGEIIVGTSVVLNSIISLFIMIMAGLYGHRREILSEEINKGLINILIQIALPCMVFCSFLNTYGSEVKENVIKTVWYSLGAYILMGAASFLLLLPVKKDKRTILHFANIFVNTGYVGFPVLNSLYGSEGVVYGSIFNMFFVIFVWTYGISLYKGDLRLREFKCELKNALLNPSIIAVGAGLLVMFLNIQIPDAIIAAARGIGNLTVPLSMMIIGFTLSKVKYKEYLRDWTVYYGVLVKLVVLPLIIYLAALPVGITSIAVKTVIIMSALPASAMTSIFADAFDREKEYAALVVSATTLLSLITITFFVGFLL